MSRRARSRARGTAIGPAGLLGIGNLNATNYYSTAAGAGTPGDAAGFFVAFWGRLVNVTNANFWANCSPGTSGWSLRQMAATTLQFRAWDGGAVSRVSPALTLTGLENQVVAVMGLHTGSALRLYANRAQVGTETALVGYTAPPGANGHTIALANPAGVEFYGMVSGNGVPSLANFQSWCDALKAGRKMVDMVGVGGQHMWLPSATIGNLTDQIGSSTMTKFGTGHTLVITPSPVWSW